MPSSSPLLRDIFLWSLVHSQVCRISIHEYPLSHPCVSSYMATLAEYRSSWQCSFSGIGWWMNLRILNTWNVCNICTITVEIFFFPLPLVLEKQKAEVNVEVATAGKRSWRAVTLSRSCNNQNGRVESYSHLLIFPTLWWYIRATTQNGEKYCQGGVEILHLRPDARIAVPTDDNLPLATCSTPTIRIARVREIRARWQWDSRQVRHLLPSWNNYRLNFQLVDTCTTRHETLRYISSRFVRILKIEPNFLIRVL